MADAGVGHALSNAQRAYSQLELFLAEPIVSDRDAAGVIQAFEFTFEATWKLLQKVADGQGMSAPSPKKAIGVGYQLGLCESERVWLDMLADRNLTMHTYNRDVAQRIVTNVKGKYFDALGAALQRCAAL